MKKTLSLLILSSLASFGCQSKFEIPKVPGLKSTCKVNAQMKTEEVIKCAKEEFQPIEDEIISYLKQVDAIDAENFRTKPIEIVNSINTLLKEAETKIVRAKGVYKDFKAQLEASVQKTREMAKNQTGMGEMLNQIEKESGDKIDAIELRDGDIEIFIKHTRIIVKKLSDSAKFFNNTPFSDEDAAKKLKQGVVNEIAQFKDIEELIKKAKWMPTFSTTSPSETETVKEDPREIKDNDAKDIKDLEKKLGL